MKKKSIVILLTTLLLLLTSCGNNSNTATNINSNIYNSNAGDATEYIATAPAVTIDMNQASYWISKCTDADEILMNIYEINKINSSNEPTLDVGNGTEITLSEIDNQMPGSQVLTLLETFSSPENPSSLYADGKRTTESYWNKIIENINANDVDSTVNITFAFTTERVDVKASPTSDFISDNKNDLHYDINAVAECAPYEPIAILHKSNDGKWIYIAAYGYAGWIPEKSVALCTSRNEWLKYQNPEEFLVVTGREIRLAYDPYDTETSNQLIPMGTKLILIRPEDAPDDFNGRASYNSYIIKIPCRGIGGKIKDNYALIPISDDVSIGYLPYTRANILTQAFKRLGDRYGWAGNYYSNDCSGIIKEIFACFGFDFPRNGKAQIRMNDMVSTDFSKLTDDEKLNHLSSLPAGSLLYFPGHIMLYLGIDNNTPFVISAVGNMATTDMKEGDAMPVNSVIINSLLDTTRKTGQTWLNCITNVLTCEVQ